MIYGKGNETAAVIVGGSSNKVSSQQAGTFAGERKPYRA